MVLTRKLVFGTWKNRRSTLGADSPSPNIATTSKSRYALITEQTLEHSTALRFVLGRQGTILSLDPTPRTFCTIVMVSLLLSLKPSKRVDSYPCMEVAKF